jgi:hypothetical protein
VLPGKDLFVETADCIVSPADLGTIIMRSVDFTWPEIALGTGEASRQYQVRGFYDADGDFNPFFSVTNLPTRGDVAGGAFASLVESPPVFLPVELPGIDSPEGSDGAVVSGVTVALAAPVLTERPVFRINEDGRAMASRATFPVPSQDQVLAQFPPEVLAELGLRGGQIANLTAFAATLPMGHPLSAPVGGLIAGLGAYVTGLRDGVTAAASLLAFEELLHANSGTVLELYSEGDLELATFANNGVALATDSSGYAWTLRGVDTDGDGAPNKHPVLGDDSDPESLDLVTPYTILRRVRSAEEIAAGVPDVLFLGSARLLDVARRNDPVTTLAMPAELTAGLSGIDMAVGDALDLTPYTFSYDWTLSGGDSYGSEIDMIVTPAAVVDLDPTKDGLCRVPYIPPGALAEVYEGTPKDCRELPTGRYAVNVLHGRALSTSGETFSGQAWTIPNDLGNPEQVVDGEAVADQGTSGMFVVHDLSADDNPVDSRDGSARPTVGCDIAVDPALVGIMDPPVRPVVWVAPLDECCAAILHLCDVPLCGLSAVDDDHAVATGTVINADGTPSCIPFPMPSGCCDSALTP